VPPRAHIVPSSPPRLRYLVVAVAATLVAVLLFILWLSHR
jgi:hypothetical protein